jgi:hypothetical protein
MSLKKIFFIELLSGIIFMSFPVLCFFIHITTVVLDIAYVIYFLVFMFFVNFFERKKQTKDEKDWAICRVAFGLSAILPFVLLILGFFFGNNFKTHTGQSFMQFLPIFLIPFWLLLHSILGLNMLNLGWAENDITKFRKSIIELFNSDSYLEIKQSFFILMIVVGIFFLGFAYFQIHVGRLFTFLYPIVMIIYVYDYKSKTRNKKKRKFNEREKYFLYKTISIATFFLFVLLFILFWLGNVKLFGHLLNEMWGMLVFPLFFSLWGVTGLVMLKKKSAIN